jgi:glycosyltransferase involved in cell wall biosynthesis
MNAVRVLHVGPDKTDRGGISSVLSILHSQERYFSNYGYLLSFIATTSPQTLSLLGKCNLFARTIALLVLALARHEVDLVHLHSAVKGSLVRKVIFSLVCMMFQKPYVLHVHSGLFIQAYRNHHFLMRYFIRLALRRAHAVLTLSHDTWEEVCQLGLATRASCHLVFNGIPDPLPSMPAPISDRPVRIAFLGLFIDRKGIFCLIDAVSRITRDLPDFKVLLGGNGDVEGVLRASAEKGVSSTVEYCGWLNAEEKHALLASSHIFVLPSRVEGFPVSIVEAMAHGLAILSTKIPGVLDAVRDDIDGLLISPDDSRALAAGLERLIADSNERDRLGKSARQRYLDTFTVEKMCQRLIGIYDSIFE